MSKSTIEWTDRVWNPVTGCTKVSQGCKNCYAEVIANRFWDKPCDAEDCDMDGENCPKCNGTRKIKRLFTDVQCHSDRLEQPLHWRKPSMVFVNSMSDLFHEDVPYEFIAKVFDVMCTEMVFNCKKCKDKNDYLHEQSEECFKSVTLHTYQILTKRPERIEVFFDWVGENWSGDSPLNVVLEMLGKLPKRIMMGTSIENQPSADIRIPPLLKAGKYFQTLFLSCEPLLGEVDLHKIKWYPDVTGYSHFNVDVASPLKHKKAIHWVICGGESGHGARPMHPAWARKLRDDCNAAGVPYFFKQFSQTGDMKKWYKQYEYFPEDLQIREFPNE